MKRILLLLWFVANLTLVNAQVLSGTVMDENRKPIQDVNMVLVDRSSKTLSFTLTDEQGRFSIQMPKDTTSLKLVFRLLGYKSVSIGLGDFKDKQTVVMRSTAIQLKEVSVRGHSITQRGDTLNYLVAGFKQSQDRSIADVIAKMPGLEVKSNGQITFEGKPINKFYIEGMDLMGRKYAQASENLSADKVKSVQILQNHQPIKSLSDVEYSDVAALNIRLTDDAKNVWAGVLEVGAGLTAGNGSDLLYSGKLMSMIFGKKQQNISIYKCDNSGKDIAHELNYLTKDDADDQEESGLLNNISAVAPDLDGRRTTYNTTHLASTNHLIRTAHDNDFRVQLDYIWNRNVAGLYQETTYNDLNGALFCEDNQTSAIDHSVKSEIKYEVNKKKIYACNRLCGALNFDKSYGETTLNGARTNQNVRPRKHYLTEDYRMVLPISEGRSISFGSQTTFSYLPGRLLTFEGYNELLTFNTLESHNYVSFRYKIKNFNMSYQAGFRFRNQQMHVSYEDTDAREHFHQQDMYLQTAVNYAFHDLKVKAELKVNGQHSSFGNTDKYHPMLLPSLSLQYDVTAESTIMANYKYAEICNALTDLFRTPTFTSYYVREANSGLLDYRKNHTTMLMWSYKHPIKGNFFDVTASWQRRNNVVLFRNRYQDNTLMRDATDQRYAANSYFVQGSAAHSFSWAKTFVSLTSQYSVQQFRLLQNDVQVPCNISDAMFGLKISMQPADFFSYELQSDINTNKQKSDNKSLTLNGNKMSNAVSTLSLFFFPVKSLEIGCSNEWYHNSVKGTSNYYFLDAHVSYRAKKYGLRLDLYNLLGNQNYENRVISTATDIYTLYKLRPREGMLTVELNL
jgi:hypothetical protein